MSNPIITENANTGSTGWQLSQPGSQQICAYVDKCSYSVGDTINIYVSTQVANTSYTITIYRLGWYGGTGGRLMQTLSGFTGVVQGRWNGTTLVNDSTSHFDSTTRLLEARWNLSTTFTIPSNWVTGSYTLIFTDANGYQWYAPFVLKGNTTADYVVVRPNTTEAAYNSWGGYSLYAFNSLNGTPATKVSFDRPQYRNTGSGYVFEFEMPLIKWLERQGYNLSYISNIDLHANVSQLLNYKAYISLCHDEYWTKEMYDGVTAARDAGISLAFMGGNTNETQVRLETGGLGGVNRTVVCYRVTSSPNTLANDPYYGVDNTRVTADWTDPVLNRPENTMIGIQYTALLGTGNNVAWTVDANADTTYFAGTGLVKGSSYGYDLVGYEVDNIQSGGPSNVKTIATTSVTKQGGGTTTSNTTFYRASSGALVFATGSVGWVGCLDAYRYAVQGGGTPAEIPQMQTLMANIMGALKGPVFSTFGV